MKKYKMKKARKQLKRFISALIYTFDSFDHDKTSFVKKFMVFSRMSDSSFEFAASLAAIMDGNDDVALNFYSKNDLEYMDKIKKVLEYAPKSVRITSLNTPSYIGLSKVLDFVTEEMVNPFSKFNGKFDIRKINASVKPICCDGDFSWETSTHKESDLWRSMEEELSNGTSIDEIKKDSVRALCVFLSNPLNRLETLDVSHNLSFSSENRYKLFETMKNSEFCNIRNLAISAVEKTGKNLEGIKIDIIDVANTGKLHYVDSSPIVDANDTTILPSTYVQKLNTVCHNNMLNYRRKRIAETPAI